MEVNKIPYRFNDRSQYFFNIIIVAYRQIINLSSVQILVTKRKVINSISAD